MLSTKTIRGKARVAGLLYLGMAVAAGVAGFARTTIAVPGDAAATAANIRASEALFRVGVVADLVQATLFLLTALALYGLLRNVNRLAAVSMVALVAVSVAIQVLSLVGELAALSIATGGDLAASMGQASSDSLVLLAVELQHDAFVLSQMFFGLWLVPLGYLVITSRWFPRVLGYLLILACTFYVVDLFAYFLAPDLEPMVLPLSAVSGMIGELSFMAWLLVKGARPATGRESGDGVQAVEALPAGA
jgi:Domain of unknown function (DUF4386)